MFAHEGAEPVFDTPASKEGGILRSSLPVKVEFRGPPGAGAVLKLSGSRAIAMALSRLGEGGFGLDFEVSGLLKIMGISDEVGLFLGLRHRKAGKTEKEGGQQSGSWPEQ